MNNRERILNTVLGLPTDRKPLFFYFGPWSETIDRWRTEGLLKPWTEEFALDPGIEIVQINLGYCPSFDQQIILDKGETRIIRDSLGIVQEVRTHGASIPHYIDYPVKCAEDWETLKKRLNPDDPARFPVNWEQLLDHYRNTDTLLQLGCYPYGLFGTLRDMMGVEELLINFIEQPELIHNMMDYLTDFWLAIYEKVCKFIHIDVIHIWEDMSGRNGSLISPRMVREFMLPNYRKIRTFADQHGITIVSVDTDGDCSELVPLFIESGINMIFPFEVQAGSDINVFATKYPELCIMGGFNKQALWDCPAAIDCEFDRIKDMFQPGVRYIAAPDHLIPPEVSLENFRYFMKRLHEMIGT